ncbi:MAG: hypothetical protein AB7N70_04855 [Dehalococcoidia bacterium]
MEVWTNEDLVTLLASLSKPECRGLLPYIADLEARLADAEATGRAAVLALRASGAHSQCPHWRRAVDAALATPTARRWAEESEEVEQEGQDG